MIRISVTSIEVCYRCPGIIPRDPEEDLALGPLNSKQLSHSMSNLAGCLPVNLV